MEFDFDTETITPNENGNIKIGGTGCLIIPQGTTSQRPLTPISGMLRYNTELSTVEHYNTSESSWSLVPSLPPQTGNAGKQLMTDGTELIWDYSNYDSRNVMLTWGGNLFGQLGDGTTISKSSPVQIGSLNNWVRISSNSYNTAAIDTEGRLWTWGLNSDGQLGNGTTTAVSSPVQVGSLTDWKEISVSKNCMFAIKKNKTLWAWGANGNGELGDGTTTQKSSPVQIGTLNIWEYVSTNWQHTAAIDSFGNLWTWGYNGSGQLGDGTTTNRSSPVQVGSLTDWAVVSCGYNHTAAISTDGNIWTWGDDSYGQLGDGIDTLVSIPTQLFTFGAAGWTSIATGYGSTCGIRQDGSLWSWGLNSAGQLGDGTMTDQSLPTIVDNSSAWVHINGFDYSYIAVKNDGTLWTWGYNGSGQLGDGTTTNRSSPVQVGTLTDWSRIKTNFGIAETHSIGLKTNSKVLPLASGGTGLGYTGIAQQLIGMSYDNQSLEYKTLRNGAGIQISYLPGIIEITSTNNGTVTSVGVSGGTTGLTTSGGPITNSGTITLGGTLGIANGGTGQTTANAALNALLPSQTGNNGRVLASNGTNASWAALSNGTVTSVGVSGGTTGLTTSGGPITGSGTITLGGTLGIANGGTGLTSVIIGNILYGSGTNTLAALTAGAAGTVLTSAGAAAPTWGKVALSSIADIGQLSVLGRSTGSVGPVAAINAGIDDSILRRSSSVVGFGSINLASSVAVGSSVLSASNGGTGQSTYAIGDMLYSGSSNTLTKLTGNITTTKQFLSQTGTGSASAAPSWSTVTKSDVGLNLVENTALSTWVGSSNITTLGTISTGTWNATNISIAKGGTGLSTTPTNGQLLIGNGTNYTLATLTQGTGMTITNGAGSITVTNAGVTSIAGTTDQITASASTGAVTLSLPSFVAAPGRVQVPSYLHQTTTSTSAAGTDQATATGVQFRYTIVTSVAAGTGVRLPASPDPYGNEIYIRNAGANSLNIYPQTSGTIGTLAVNAPLVLPAGQETTLVHYSLNQWYVTEPILNAGTNTTLTTGSGSYSYNAIPSGSTTQVQYNNAGTFAGAANVTIDNNDLILAYSASPVTPAADQVKLFGRKLANRMLPAMVGPSGLDACMQPAIWRQKVAWWNPPGNATTVPGVLGMAAPTAVGTATSRTVATTNLMSRTRRLGYVSAATAGALCGHYATTAQYTTGTGSDLGGFFYSCRFAFSDAASVAGARAFIGMTSSTAAPSNVQPNTLTNCIGVAQLSTDATQMYIVYGGSVAQTAIALGTDFPPMTAAGVTNGVVYDLTIFSPPSLNAVVYYRLERIGTTFMAEGTLSGTPGTTTPANTTLLAHRAWRTNNTTLSAVGVDIINVYIETDY